MRRLLAAAVLAGVVTSAAALTGPEPRPRVAVSPSLTAFRAPAPWPRVALSAGISIPVPPGWHLLRGRLSDVIDPMPRLALASFPARLSRHECACGAPNVTDFPANGAFLFVWEYRGLTRHFGLKPFPGRAGGFRLAAAAISSYACAGPSDSIAFREAGREFQADVYIGPKASPHTRAELLWVLDRFHA